MIRKQAGLLGWNGVLARLLITAVTIGVLATARPSEPWAWPVLVAALLSFLAGTFLMHRYEVVALGLLSYAALSAAVVTGMPGSNALILVLVPVTDVAVMTFARTPRLRRNQPIIAVGIGCLLLYGVSAQLYDRTSSWFLSQLLWTAVLILFGLNRRYDELRAQQTRKLLDQTVLAQREHSRAAALDERTRIARELHDVLAHSLGALSVQLELAEALLSEKDDRPAALDRIRRSRRLAVQGLVEARNAVATLRQDQVPALPEALELLVQQHGQHHGGTPSFTVTGEVRRLDSGVVVALLGAARESLTNAARHAPGHLVELHLAYSPTTVRLQIRNRLGQPAMRPEGSHAPRPLRPEKEESEPAGLAAAAAGLAPAPPHPGTRDAAADAAPMDTAGTAGTSAAKPAGVGGSASAPPYPAEARGADAAPASTAAGSSAEKPSGVGGSASAPPYPAEARGADADPASTAAGSSAAKPAGVGGSASAPPYPAEARGAHAAPASTAAGSSAAEPAGVGGSASAPPYPAEARGADADPASTDAGSSAAKPAGVGGLASPSPSPAEAGGASEGFGVAGMRERLALVGGGLSAGVVDGEWVVVAEVADE